MDVLAWEKRIINEKKYDEKICYDVFVYKNPLITPPKKENECYRIDTVNFDYKEWIIDNDVLSEKPNGFFLGKGFKQDFFLYLNEKLTLDLISNKTGIDKEHLEVMLKKNEGL